MFFEETLANAYVQTGGVEMIHEDKLLEIAHIFKEFVEDVERDYDCFELFDKRKEDLASRLTHQILMVFQSF